MNYYKVITAFALVLRAWDKTPTKCPIVINHNNDVCRPIRCETKPTHDLDYVIFPAIGSEI